MVDTPSLHSIYCFIFCQKIHYYSQIFRFCKPIYKKISHEANKFSSINKYVINSKKINNHFKD